MLFVTGDVHGVSWDLDDRMERLAGVIEHPLGRDDEVLLLGDVGLRYGLHEGRDLLAAMRQWDVTFVVMRGNHDARYWRDLDAGMYGDGYRETTWRGGPVRVDARAENVLYLPDDGGLYENDGHPFLVIPGAFSVDGTWRVATGAPYELEEQLTASEMDRIVGLSEGGGIEHVFSHTCPLSWLERFSDLMLPGIRQDLVDKTMERMMDVVLENVGDGLRGWWFGHYHDDRPILGTDGVGHMLRYSVLPVE